MSCARNFLISVVSFWRIYWITEFFVLDSVEIALTDIAKTANKTMINQIHRMGTVGQIALIDRWCIRFRNNTPIHATISTFSNRNASPSAMSPRTPSISPES